MWKYGQFARKSIAVLQKSNYCSHAAQNSRWIQHHNIAVLTVMFLARLAADMYMSFSEATE